MVLFRRRKTKAEGLQGHALATALDDVGFWQDVTGERDRLRDLVAAGGHPLEAMGNRGWVVDGEDLAEGLVEQLLREIAPAMARRGIPVQVGTIEGPHELGSKGYTIEVNGKLIDLYRYAPGGGMVPATADPWTDCTLLPLASLNEALESAGSEERIVVFGAGGNDGIAYVLPLPTVSILRSVAQGPHEIPIVA